ncbi:MAG: septum formation initiator family protein [Chitinophagaceae bacterium]|nr:septum formation initiator family protein [Chitinophagaceae bacterium]
MQYFRFFKNKYLLTGLAFAAWLLFFDDRDLVTTMKHHQELKQLQQSRDHYTSEVKKTNEELEQLKNDPATLEKYAREKYRMKKDNEDLFIVVK